MIKDPRPQLLATKVLLPRSAAGLIDRPRLLEQVCQVQSKRLTVVKAAAGFGKTTLAVAWARRLQQDGHSVAWVTLDPDDDEPRQFLLYVANALGHARAGLGEVAIGLASDISLVPPRTIVATLINELVDSEDEIYLFLEDYHWLDHPEIHDALSYLLMHAPSQMHVVVTTRTEPPLPLARLRALNELLEIDASALRFDVEETRQFLERESLGTLDPFEMSRLLTQTEGWPAVLRIIASTSLQLGADLGDYVRDLSAALRPIGAYLAELLGGLAPDLVRFMMQTCILDRLSAPLCQAVTGMKSSRDLLKSMEGSRLLVTPLDQEGRWYRYHPLLAGHLREQLEIHLSDDIPWLHRRAYRWYAANELWTDAVQHAIAAGDTDRAVSWIENCAMALVKKGDLLTLLGWQRLFPTELMRSQIKVRLAITWGLALAMRFEESLRLVTEIEMDLANEGMRDHEALRCECQIIRAVAVALGDDSQAAVPIAAACQGRAANSWNANVASNVCRFGYWKAGDLENFYATPWIPYSDEEDRRNVFSSVYRLCFQGLVEVDQLQLDAAERHYLAATHLAERHVGANSVAAALPASLIAEIRYEQGRLDEAEAMVLDRLPIISATGTLDCVARAYSVLARVSAYRMNSEQAMALLDRAENLGHRRDWDRLVAVALYERLRLYLAQGRITEGGACLGRLEHLAAARPVSGRCAWSEIHDYAAMARAQLAMAENRLPESIAILERLHRDAESGRRRYFALRVGTLLAVALLSANRDDEALNVFRGILDAARPGHIFQTILDQGPEIGTLLARLQDKGPRGAGSGEFLAYRDRLLAGWQKRYQPERAPGAVGGLPGPLSPRERSTLELIGQGQSNKEIARALGITPETVKSHVKHIFVKLGVERRTQAVSRAQNLGLIEARY